MNGLEDLEGRPREDGEGERAPSSLHVALSCLVTAAQMLGIPAEMAQLKRVFPEATAGPGCDVSITLLRAARKIVLKAQVITTGWERLHRLPVPSLLLVREAAGVNVLLLLKVNPALDNCLLFSPLAGDPFVWPREELESKWDGEAIPLARRFFRSGDEERFGLAWFIPVILRFKKHFLEVFAGSFFLQVFGLVSPLFSQVIIDKVLVHRGVTTLDVLVIGICAINLFEWVLGVLRTYIFSHTTNRVDVILGMKLFRHLLSLPLPYFEARTVGVTIARLRELEIIRSFITGTALTTVLDLFFTVIFIATLFYYSVKLAFVSLATLPFFILLSVIVTPLLRERLNNKFTCNADSQSYMVEAVSGIHTVKSLAIEPQLNGKWENLLANYVNASFKAGFLGALAGNTAQFIQKCSSLLILWFGARMVMGGELSVGQLIAFQMIAGRVTEPVLRLAQLWQEVQQVRLSVDRLGDVLNFPAEPDIALGRSAPAAIEGAVSIHEVCFRYRPDGPLVLDGVSLEVQPGTTVGIVGRSGSGKSTLTKLLQRLYLPESGRILMDGMDLAQMDPAWLRRQIGVVLQDNFLFSGTVRENIAQTDAGASLDKVISVAKLAGAHEFIVELREGYDTQVGERGAFLSGGQRQRIAIARALLSDPRILIFDEATSALDYQSERIIQDNLAQISSGRTVFIIAHRLSTVSTADFLIVMEKGRIAERGTHDELLEREGIYASLYRQQSGRGTCL